MSGDLRYFYERDLDRTNLRDFYESLPSSIKYKFRASLNAAISTSNALQGYRGPSHMCNNGSGDSDWLHSSHGLQEIRYWWATTKGLNYVPVAGTIIFGIARGCEKLGGETDWSSLYFDSKTGQCLSHDKDEAAEELNKIGLRLYKEGKYSEAVEYHNNAYRACTSGYRNEQKFKDNARKAKSKLEEKSSNYQTVYEPAPCSSRTFETRSSNYNGEDNRTFRASEEYYGNHRPCLHDVLREYIDRQVAASERQASELCRQGDAYYYQENYDAAEVMYKRALYQSPVKSRSVHEDRLAATRNEKSASTRNAQGDVLFERREFAAAQKLYKDALETSQDTEKCNLYVKNMRKAQFEDHAKIYNAEGDILFEQGEFYKALDKYQAAYSATRIGEQENLYAANRAKAQTERDALQLYSEGEDLLRRRQFSDAQRKFQGARMKSKVPRQIHKYEIKENMAKSEMNEAIKGQLRMLDTLWQQAWNAELNDRPDEASQLFARILSESRRGLEIFPGTSKFKQYETIVTLKIEGNQLFNQGLESQNRGVTLFEEAQQLNRQAKYELANAKFKQAKSKFLEAREKFERGKQSDQRFSSCVEFVQEVIDEVTQSVEITEQRMLTIGLNKLDVNGGNGNRSDARSCETNQTATHVDYSAQI